MGLQLRQ